MSGQNRSDLSEFKAVSQFQWEPKECCDTCIHSFSIEQDHDTKPWFVYYCKHPDVIGSEFVLRQSLCKEYEGRG